MTWTRRGLPLLRTRLPTTAPTAGVLLGDLLVLFAFVATGQYAHNYYFWQAPLHTVFILIPFVIAWLVVAPLFGLFRRTTLGSLRQLVPRVGAAWIAASLVGGAIRATPLFPGGAPLSFLLANVAFGLLFFVSWRVLVVVAYRRR